MLIPHILAMQMVLMIITPHYTFQEKTSQHTEMLCVYKELCLCRIAHSVWEETDMGR